MYVIIIFHFFEQNHEKSVQKKFST
jgi:hypothetical protein